MAFCSNCGAPVEGQFCQKCGTPVASAPGATYTPPVYPTATQAAGLSVNAASALCYLFGLITGIVFLVLAPYNQDRRVRFHAFQSIFLNVAVIVIQIGITVLSLMFSAVSVSLGFLMSSLHLIVSLGFLLIWLYMMWKSYQGEKIVLPLIGPLAERQAGQNPPGTIGSAV
jgi:uncharacterized membrane protein